MSDLKPLLSTMRIPFLLLTPVCVGLGLGTAVSVGAQVDWLHFALAMLGAVSAHISVNTFNEYFDFKTGLDAKTQRTPFSGGSGSLPTHPKVASKTLIAAMATLAITAGVGLYFLFVLGPVLLPLGLAGLLLIVTYTTLVTKRPVLCLLAPGVGFGPIMVVGTHLVLTGTYSLTALVASAIPFFLVNDLLLLNQFPDVEADRTVGRRHLPITIGRSRSSLVYIAFLQLPFAVIGSAVLAGVFPVWCLLGVLPLVLTIPMSIGVKKNAEVPAKLVPYMGRNVLVNLVTPALVTVGLFL